MKRPLEKTHLSLSLQLPWLMSSRSRTGGGQVESTFSSRPVHSPLCPRSKGARELYTGACWIKGESISLCTLSCFGFISSRNNCPKGEVKRKGDFYRLTVNERQRSSSQADRVLYARLLSSPLLPRGRQTDGHMDGRRMDAGRTGVEAADIRKPRNRIETLGADEVAKARGL